MRAVAASLAAVLLAGCSADRPARAPAPAVTTTAPAPSSSATVTSTPPAGVTVVAVPAGFEGGFRTPTGNIACDVSDGFVRCDAQARPWQELPRKECGGTAAWRTRLVLHEDSGATLRGECGYDPPRGGPPLAYGTRLDVGTVRCLSERSGLTCWVAGTRRGFVVSRAEYRLTADPPAAAASATSPPPSDSGLTEAPRGFRGGFQNSDYGIVCDISDATVHCLMLSAQWQPPPAREPCTDGDRSTELILANGRAESFQGCRSDSLAGGFELAEGRAVRIGDLRCETTKGGIGCRNARTKHGFYASQEAFRRY